ncbi:MAG: tetratricopeptide repeat protein [Candidatus Heimdallarchaeota archaeon]|nr:MAG: tetratricopeptide repeat protein [Candidatus Heimdallarchaeota archaeon]
MVHKIRENLDRAEKLLRWGKVHEAQELVDTLSKMEGITPDIILSSKLIRGKISVKQGRFQDTQELAEEVLKECSHDRKTYYSVDALVLLAEASWRTGRLDEGLTYIREGEEILNEIGGEKKRETQQRKGELLYQKGIISSRKGQLDEALEFLTESLSFRKKIGNNPYGVGEALNSIGVTYFYMGLLEKALKVYLASLEIKKNLGNIQQLAIAYNNIGDLFFVQGELKSAEIYYQRSLKLFQDTGNKEHISNAIHNVGKLYHHQGEFDQALGHLEKALSIAEELGNNISISENLYHLIHVALDKNDPDLSQKYFQYLQQIVDTIDNPIVQQRFQVAEALILKSKERIRSKMKALELLGDIIRGERVNHELTIAAMLHSCDLLLFELRIYGEDEILLEVKEIAKQLLEIASEQAQHSLLAETYLLQSRLSMIELDIENAQELLSKAYSIAEKRGLSKLANTIAHEKDLLPKWEKIIDQHPDMKDTTELTQVDDLVQRMIHKKVPKSEREIKNYVLEAKELLEAWQKGRDQKRAF